MSLESEARRDRIISESLVLRGVGMLARVGGTALSGYMVYKHGFDSVVAIAEEALPGAAISAVGIRMGLERGAALVRSGQRSLFGGDYIGVTSAQRAAGHRHRFDMGLAGIANPLFASATGFFANANQKHVDAMVDLTLATTVMGTVAAGMVIANEMSLESAGRSTETRPLVLGPIASVMRLFGA